MNHRDRRADRGGHHIDLPMDIEGFIGHNHGKIRGSGADIARAKTHRIGGRHAGSRVALTGRHRNSGFERPARVEESGSRGSEDSAAFSRDKNLRQDGAQVNPCQHLELADHILIIVQLFAVDGKHARGLADAHKLLPGEPPVDIARECREEGDVLHMLFTVQDGLVQMGDAPALRDIEVKQLCQLRCRFVSDRIAPGAKLCQLSSLSVKGQIAVHHSGYADGAHGGELRVVPCLDIRLEACKAGLKAGMHRIH